jgi:hypothetical protein
LKAGLEVMIWSWAARDFFGGSVYLAHLMYVSRDDELLIIEKGKLVIIA